MVLSHSHPRLSVLDVGPNSRIKTMDMSNKDKSGRHDTRRSAKKQMRDKNPKVRDGMKRVSVGTVKNKDGTFRGTVTYKPIKKKAYKPGKVSHKIKTNYVSTRSKKGRLKK